MVIRGTTLEDCRALAEKALANTTYKQTDTLVKSWMAEHFPDK